MIAISLLGPPGSGKTTQAKHIAEYLDFLWISPGHIFRELEKRSPRIYEGIRSYTDRGESVPSELTYNVLTKWPQLDSEYEGYVFDSHPRNKGDMTQFRRFLEERAITLEAVIYLQVEREELLGRLNRRAYVEGREDESLAVIERRMKVFEEHTKPLIDILDSEVDVFTVNGDLSADVVWEEIKALLSPIKEKLS